MSVYLNLSPIPYPQGKIVGAVRAYEKGRVCHIGRLFVHPHHQNTGVGKALVSSIEEHFKHCALYSLFAAKRVTKNIQLYPKLGYILVKEEMGSEGLIFVHFEKRNE
jgi:GNAT superfamily N-acetyltransferase